MKTAEESTEEGRAFYKEAVELLNASGSDFMIGGGLAVKHYTGIYRNAKDLDIFCKPGEYPKIIKHFALFSY